MNNNESQSQDPTMKGETVETELSTVNTGQANIEQEFAVEPAAEVTTKKSSTGWIITSALLAIALVVVLIKPPFGGNNETIATVNGSGITKNDLYDKMVTYYGSGVLDSLISEELVAQELKAKSITLTDADLAAEIAALKLQFPSEEEFQLALTGSGMTEEDLKDNFKLSTMIRLALQSTTNVTDENIQTFFDENKASLGESPAKVRASHILVKDKEQAASILAELKAGADFAELAAQYGTDGTAQRGGDLDFFSREDMIEEFANAAFALKVNELSDIVETVHGFHIILKTDEKPATEANLDTVKDAIRVELVNQQIYANNSTYLDDLKTKATIKNTLTEEK